MKTVNLFAKAILALAIGSLSVPEVEAMQVYAPALGARSSEGYLIDIAARRSGGGHRGGGAHRPAGRPGGGMQRPPGGAHRPPAHRPPVNRPPVNRPGPRPPVNRPVNRPPVHRPVARPPVVGRPVGRPVVVAPRSVWVGRPGWYRWSPGGAVAAGAAVGFLTAAAVTWATPPQAGLCWYYTDPSRRSGFWDACP